MLDTSWYSVLRGAPVWTPTRVPAERLDPAPPASWWHTRDWLTYEALCAGCEDVAVWSCGPRVLPANVVGDRLVYRDRPQRARPPITPGWRDDGWPTQVLDLVHTSPADRWAVVRRSYKSVINRARARGRYRLHVWDHTPADAALDACRRLHATVAGLETRPKATWALMADWLRQGHALLVTAHEGGPTVTTLREQVGSRAADGSSPSPSTTIPVRKMATSVKMSPAVALAMMSSFSTQKLSDICVETSDNLLGFAYVYAYHGWAYYGHAVNVAQDVGAAIQWTAIEALANRGDVTHYELGWQEPTDDPKEQAIQFFKRGFGGDPWWQPILTPEGA